MSFPPPTPYPPGLSLLGRAGSVRLIFVGDQPTFVMLSEAKHLANEGNLRFFSWAAQILR